MMGTWTLSKARVDLNTEKAALTTAKRLTGKTDLIVALVDSEIYENATPDGSRRTVEDSQPEPEIPRIKSVHTSAASTAIDGERPKGRKDQQLEGVQSQRVTAWRRDIGSFDDDIDHLHEANEEFHTPGVESDIDDGSGAESGEDESENFSTPRARSRERTPAVAAELEKIERALNQMREENEERHKELMEWGERNEVLALPPGWEAV